MDTAPLPASLAAAYREFWTAAPDQLPRLIVNPDRWVEETRLHLEQIFRGRDLAAVLRYPPPRVPPLAPTRLLEIGCGIGRLLRPLLAMGHQCVGLDFSPAMIAEAKLYLGPDLAQRAELHCLPVPTFDWPAVPAVDVVFAFLSPQHWPTRELFLHYLRAAHAATRVTGILRLQNLRATPNPGALKEPTFHGATYPSIELMVADIEACGWRVVATDVGLGHPEWDWVTARKPAPG